MVNVDYLDVLKKTRSSNKLFVDKYYFENIFKHEIENYKELFLKEKQVYSLDNLDALIEYIRGSLYLKQLSSLGKSSYCEEIDKNYQGFEINLEREMRTISLFKRELESRLAKIGNETSNLEQQVSKEICRFVYELDKKILLWTSAFSINKAYKECKASDDVLFFSHRLLGWSTPETKLNEELALELKTNFGYGKSSYFLLKFKYLDIDVVSFLDCIRYPYAIKGEPVSYTKRFEVKHEDWGKAFVYTAYAYNLLNSNKVKFVEEIVVSQLRGLLKYLEEMTVVSGKTGGEFNRSESGEKKIVIQNDESKIILNPEVEEVSHVINSLRYIPIIGTYSKFLDVNGLISNIEDIVSKVSIVIPDIEKQIEKKFKNYSEKVESKITALAGMKDRYLEYNKNMKGFTYEKGSNDCTQVDFLAANPEYESFHDIREAALNELDQAQKNQSKCKIDMKRLVFFLNEIHEYMSSKISSKVIGKISEL